MTNKQILRKSILTAKKKLTIADKQKLSAIIFQRLEQLEIFKKATKIALYSSLPDEVETSFFLEKWKDKKELYLPIVSGENLQFAHYQGNASLHKGAYGILEPSDNTFLEEKDLQSIELILVPGVAFDKKGMRLGRGKGYYDRILPKFKAYKIGICWDLQLVPQIPSETFDIKMDAILTESQYLQ